MADDERDVDPAVAGEEEEDEEAWTEPVPLDGLPAGNTSIFVGGFSSLHGVAQALTLWKHKDDTIIVLPGTYDADVSLDAVVHQGLRLQGDASAPGTSIVFKGLLDVAYTAPAPSTKQQEAQDEEDEEGKAKAAAPPRPLAIGNMTFLAGAVFSELSDCDVNGCTFGHHFVDATSVESVPRTVRVHGLSTARFEGCTVYGMGRSAVYAYPHSRARFSKCTVVGAKKPPPPPPEHDRRRKRVVVPPPPPPSVPASCECEVGLHFDDSSCRFEDCVVNLFTIGAVFNDKCTGTVIEKTTFSEIGTVGALFGPQSVAAMRNSSIKLCGRECVVVGAGAHPTLRSNIFVGDARLKEGAIATGISDNVLGLDGKLFIDGSHFVVKGFTTVSKDPTIVKPKKVEEEDA